VRLARMKSREVFVPLAHPPGYAQVDFGECIGIIGGVRTRPRPTELEFGGFGAIPAVATY
jgi:hypothetical protein